MDVGCARSKANRALDDCILDGNSIDPSTYIHDGALRRNC